MSEMSNRQSFAIKCASGLDVRGLDIDYSFASEVISKLNDEHTYEGTVAVLQGKGATGNPKGFSPYNGKAKKGNKVKTSKKIKGETQKDHENRELYERAAAAGEEAARAHEAIPMQVVEHTNPLNDNSPIKRAYAPTAGGVCGFSWTVIRDGRTSFAKWLVKNNKGKQSEYYGGVIVWGEDTKYSGQSMSTKESYTNAFARVLEEAGIKLQTYSRMD